MKKIISVLFTAALIITSFSAKSEEQHTNPQMLMIDMVQCQSATISLIHLHKQIAASLLALSGPTGKEQLKSMIDGYSAIATSEEEKLKVLGRITKEVVIPQILAAGIPADMLKAASNGLMNKIMEDIMTNLNNPKYAMEEKVAIETSLQTQSDECTDRFNKLLATNTY